MVAGSGSKEAEGEARGLILVSIRGLIQVLQGEAAVAMGLFPIIVGGGRSGYGGYGGYGSQNNYGYQGFHGANRGRRPYYGGYGGKRCRGAGYGGQQFQQQATPNPTPMGGGNYGTGAHIADQMGHNLGAQQQHATVPATGTKSATGGVPIAVTADNHLGSAVLADPQPGHPSAGQELHQAPPAGLHKQGSKLELSPHCPVENKTTAEVPKDTVPHNPDNEPMNVDLPESSKAFVDVVVGEFIYQLHFGVEQEAPEGEPILLDLDSKLEDEEPNEDDDPNDDDPKEEGNGDKPMDIDKKKADQTPHPTKKAGISGTSQQDSPSVEAAKNNSKPGEPNPVILMTAEPTGDWNAKLLNPNNDSAKLNKLKGQKGGTVSPVRSSKRTAATSEQDSVEKATKLKARHNLEIANDKEIIYGIVWLRGDGLGVLFREHTGFDSGHTCSGMTINGSS
ncbi:uncharacterized protein LOC110437519 [Sorghum bicolor]|uniref:uncharacterized protein LOC110437519 n=1 Tax=Sorghum bicolor TaxID=4558 RepID=UPI000B4244A9|nr:uncharacterized protein LOC110437519 [Sorghum bicolor]|eukprot:XP_021321667.1 uncharacterized protein LOC110437519 [Sorghum bicolor]